MLKRFEKLYDEKLRYVLWGLMLILLWAEFFGTSAILGVSLLSFETASRIRHNRKNKI